MASPIRHLEAESILVDVFNQLDSLDDFVVCSSVSKTWNALVRESRPNSLTIRATPYFPSLNAEGIVGVLGWLQAKQRAGHLQNLRKFLVLSESSVGDQEIRLQPAFLDAAVMFTGLWNLQSCTMEGFFCLTQAVALLPTTLKQLELTPAQPPRLVELSNFSRFSTLQLLTLAGPQEGLPVSYVLLNGSMPAIRSLKAHKPFQIVASHDEQVEARHSRVTAVLPCLVQFGVSVAAAATSDGDTLANICLNLKGLKELDLCLLEPGSGPIVLKLLASSSLALLRVEVHPDVQVSLELQKKNVKCELSGVTTVLMPRPFRGLSKMRIV